MNEQDVINLIKQYNTNAGGSTGSFAVPLHHHNDSDSIRIRLSDTLPFDSVNVTPTIPATVGTTYNYQIGVTTPIDYGIYLYAGGVWNTISYDASGVNAYLSTNQSIPDSTPTIVIFDTVTFDDSAEYDSATGKYNLTTTGKYVISCQVSLDGGNDIVLSLYQDNGSGPTLINSSYVTSSTTVSISSTQVRELGDGISFWFEITQDSGGAVNALANDSFLSVKKFMN